MTRLLLILPLLLGSAVPAAGAAELPRTYHVSVEGSDANPGTEALPLRTVSWAVGLVAPGDTVLLHAGIFEGIVSIKRSGTEALPIVLMPAGDGSVTLTATLPSESCAATSPTQNRTLQILSGTDYWIVQDLNVAGGISTSGSNTNELAVHLHDMTLPGRGTYDPSSTETLLLELGSNPSDGVQVLRNKVTRRGIQATASRSGRIEGNEVSQIDCGTGAGILLSRFSDDWLIRDNFVHHNAASVEHPMEEGVRISSNSNYNLIEENIAEDLSGRGRGFTTDVNASWNVFRLNVTRRAFMGFNQQHGGSGNQWLENTAAFTRGAGFTIAVKENYKSWPDQAVPNQTLFRRNCSVGNALDLNVGAIQASTFESNAFNTVYLSKNVASYWTAVGNQYDGSSTAPPPVSVRERHCTAPSAAVLTDPRGFVEQTYRDVLNREGDAAGIEAWTGILLSGGLSRSTFVEALMRSAEFQHRTAPVTTLYFAYFMHVPAWRELQSWTTELRKGMPLTEISAQFAKNPEFKNRYAGGNTTNFVTKVYLNVLGRDPDPAGLAAWTSAVDAGMSRSDMMAAVAMSAEFRNRSWRWVCLTHLYADLLRRAPDAAGFDGWMRFLNAGGSLARTAQYFLDSAEYRARFSGP